MQKPLPVQRACIDKVGICVLLCLGIHTLMDLTAGISLVLPQNIAYPVIYAIFIVMAAVSVVILKNKKESQLGGMTDGKSAEKSIAQHPC